MRFFNFTQHGTVTSDALGTPFAAFALGALSAFACTGLFADAADLVEKGMAIYPERGGGMRSEEMHTRTMNVDVAALFRQVLALRMSWRAGHLPYIIHAVFPYANAWTLGYFSHRTSESSSQGTGNTTRAGSTTRAASRKARSFIGAFTSI